MIFGWLNKFHSRMEKEPDYAEKSLAAYRLGMRAKGAILGVRIEPASDCCEAARKLPSGTVYDPDQAPRLPLIGCPRGRHCGCVYRPVMSYSKLEGN